MHESIAVSCVRRDVPVVQGFIEAVAARISGAGKDLSRELIFGLSLIHI